MRELIRRLLREQQEENIEDKPDVKTDDFIRKARLIHGDEYQYDKTNYVRSNKDVIITCPKHDDFPQSPNSHLMGRGCPVCGRERTINAKRYTRQEFIDKANEVHSNKYDYSNVSDILDNNKVFITCPKKNHGDFPQERAQHLTGRGCPRCRESKGEKYIDGLLTNNNIKFNREYEFDECSNTSEKGRCSKLPFDFYLPDNNVCIEYDGEQHYKPIYGQEQFEKTKRNDELKTRYCKDNGINLIRIPYTIKFDDIEKYIKDRF